MMSSVQATGQRDRRGATVGAARFRGVFFTAPFSLKSYLRTASD
jgi:hypothetical protein